MAQLLRSALAKHGALRPGASRAPRCASASATAAKLAWRHTHRRRSAMLGFLFAFACAPTDPDASHDRDGSDALRAPQRLDDCKPTLHGPPEITIGQGQTDYVDIAEGETLQIEKGPQGGYHVWLAVRMKNLLRSGSRTLIEANVVSTGFALQSYEVGFTFDLDEDGFCELHGLRYRIDSDGVDYRTLLGDALDLHVEISDESGSSAGASTRILLSGDVI